MSILIDNAEISGLPLSADPLVMSGAVVFKGTRVPVETLLDNLETGLSLEEFLEEFPTVSREQAVAVLEFSKRTLVRISRSS